MKRKDCEDGKRRDEREKQQNVNAPTLAPTYCPPWTLPFPGMMPYNMAASANPAIPVPVVNPSKIKKVTLPPNAPIPPWRLSRIPNQPNNSANRPIQLPLRPVIAPPPSAGIKFNIKSNSVTQPIPVTPAAASMSAVPSTSSTSSNPSTPTSWPPSLRAFVERCFSQCISDEDRDTVETALKKRIQEVLKEGKFHSYDWSKEPIVRLETVTRRGFNGENITLTGKKGERARRFLNEAAEAAQRQRSIEKESVSMRKSALLALAEEGIDWDEYSIIGTCQNLEKPYLRLTSAPNPSTVRPLPILKKTLEWLKKVWREQQHEYHYVCDQFKSLRQDLTVQRIRNEFTVQVYEIHARIALEQGDLGEYNQCQAQLKGLYSLGLAGHENEFIAYRILYYLNTQNRQEMNALLAHLTNIQKQDPCINHALKVRSSLALSDYCQFFRLYGEAPNMGGYLMDFFVKRERLAALGIICKAYRPSIEVNYLSSLLGFDSVKQCIAFLQEHSATLLSNNTLLDCKASLLHFS